MPGRRTRSRTTVREVGSIRTLNRSDVEEEAPAPKRAPGAPTKRVRVEMEEEEVEVGVVVQLSMIR